MFIFLYTALFVSISQVIGCEDRLRNDLLCVGWGVKLYSLTSSLLTAQSDLLFADSLFTVEIVCIDRSRYWVGAMTWPRNTRTQLC